MNRDFLKEMNLTEDQINKIMAQNGKDIEAVKASNTEETEKLRKLNSELTSKIDSFGNVEELKGYKTKYEELSKKYTEETNSLKLSNAIEKKLLASKVKNLDIVKKAIKLDDVKFDEKGVLTGLDEQIKALKESDGYLFEGVENKNVPPSSVGLGVTSDPKPEDPVTAAFLRKNPGIKI